MQITIHTLNIHLTPAEPALGAALVKAALAAQHEEAAEQPQEEAQQQTEEPQAREIELPPEIAALLAAVLVQKTDGGQACSKTC